MRNTDHLDKCGFIECSEPSDSETKCTRISHYSRKRKPFPKFPVRQIPGIHCIQSMSNLISLCSNRSTDETRDNHFNDSRNIPIYPKHNHGLHLYRTFHHKYRVYIQHYLEYSEYSFQCIYVLETGIQVFYRNINS